jgi:hypothetical protein
MKTITDQTFLLVQQVLSEAQYEATCLEPRLQGPFANSVRAVKERCREALAALNGAQVEASPEVVTDLHQLCKPRDETFCLSDGNHYCSVEGRIFGPWPDKGAATAGMQVEQRRAAARRAGAKP